LIQEIIGVHVVSPYLLTPCERELEILNK